MDTSHEERTHYQMRLVYSKETTTRQLFMQDLRQLRKEIEKRLLKELKELLGPGWYQVLSEPQREALRALDRSIYQDVLEGRPTRAARIIKILGLYPRPSGFDVMNAEYAWKNDPKEMLAQLFLTLYGHPIEVKRAEYTLNARLILSAILYLGLEDLLKMLELKFQPDDIPEEVVPKVRTKKEPPPLSPYLQKMEAALYLPKKPKPFQPLPLPNLDTLNEPYEEVVHVLKKPLPPPPPPPAKKKLARSYCDKIAGYVKLEPHTSQTNISVKSVKRAASRRSRNSKAVGDLNKGRSDMGGPKKKKVKKPVAPTLGMPNLQYHIVGVYTVRGKKYFVLGGVNILPPLGYLIHGGFKAIGNDYVNIHCGYKAYPPPPAPDRCDCLSRWTNDVITYLKGTKCTCGHFYDFGNEGPFNDLPFFTKPDKNTTFNFDYSTIYNTDPKSIQITKEFKEIWEKEPILQESSQNGEALEMAEKRANARSGSPCIGTNPRPSDYLKCALRVMRSNIAARLPDVHEAPELREWMRFRIYGPFTDKEKDRMLVKSERYWAMIHNLAKRVIGRVVPRKDPKFTGHSTWRYKFGLAKDFRKVTEEFKVQLFRAQAKINNLMWPSMYQPQQPDKKFREIYFSYLFSRLEDVTMMHPYNSFEATDRALTMALRRYSCPPVADEDFPN